MHILLPSQLSVYWTKDLFNDMERKKKGQRDCKTKGNSWGLAMLLQPDNRWHGRWTWCEKCRSIFYFVHDACLWKNWLVLVAVLVKRVDLMGLNETSKTSSYSHSCYTGHPFKGHSSFQYIQSYATINTTNLEQFHKPKGSTLTLTFNHWPSSHTPTSHLSRLRQSSICLLPPWTTLKWRTWKGLPRAHPAVQLYLHTCHWGLEALSS